MPFIIGSTTPIIAFVAIAASTAFPPLSRIFTPACDASGDSDATIPPFDTTMDRACVLSCAFAATAQEHNATNITNAISLDALRLATWLMASPVETNSRTTQPHFTGTLYWHPGAGGNFPFPARLFTLAFGRHPIYRPTPPFCPAAGESLCLPKASNQCQPPPLPPKSNHAPI